MHKIRKPFSTTVLIVLAVTAVVAAVTGIDTETFENELIKTLKEKFKAFYNNPAQDRVYVQTDKTLYKPGETIWFSAFVRDEKTLKPSASSDVVHVEFITPKGSVEKHIKLVALNGIAQGDLDLSGHPGGIYKIKAYTEWQKNNENSYRFEKDITVQSVVMPRLKMKLDFERKAYGKGDEVTAKLELNTNANQPLANSKVKFTASLAGKQLSANTATTDATGKTNLTFTLPKDLNTVDGLVNAMIDYEGSTESISRSVPIVLNKISMEFFAEGGDMVTGVTSRVAFRAMNEYSKPADVEGIIVDSKGAFVTKFSSYHMGMGSAELTPRAGESYRARITKPEGILDEFNLPEALTAGYTLRANNNGSKITLQVNSWRNEQLSVVAQTRNTLCYAKAFNAVKGANQLSINTTDFPIGISQITLFDSKGVARAERLVFVNANHQLNISITTDKKFYQPREKVNMNIRVTDQNGLPVPGHFALSVVDDNLLTFADDKQGHILSAMLLEPELKEKVEEPNFYFDKKEEKAPLALDLLMLTSGWRRYNWQQINSGDIPAITVAGEKAELSGVVYDGYNSKPLAGATLKLNNNGKTTVTDINGRFTLSRFDITLHTQVEISGPGHQTQTQPLYSYGNNIAYYLYDNRYRYYEAIPMAAGAAVEEREAVVVDMAVVNLEKGANRATKKDKARNERAELELDDLQQIDVAPIPAEPDAIDKDVLYKKPFDGAEVQAKIADGRWADIDNFDRKIAAQNQVTFYRAKQFPKRKYNTTDTTRNDFATTLYWNGHVTTDYSGRAKVEFIANDLVSSFRTTVEGFGDDGSIGHAETNFGTNLPFVLDAKLPTEIVAGDKMMIPVFIKNNTDEDADGNLQVSTGNQLMVTTKSGNVLIPAGQSKLLYLEAIASSTIGNGSIQIKFTSPAFTDAITRNIQVVAKGFPAGISFSGQELEKSYVINPVNVVPGSMKVTFSAYPNIMSELMSGVESILREPYGCFEQTSSSNYPNIMVLQYLNSMKIDDPKLHARATKLLDDGYKKLVAFETKENGYEWFGAAPAHEALTAYGLMEFVDMKNVYAGVDEKMIDRTVNLLLNKRDGNGGFKKNPRALDSFGAADEDVTNAYIVYSLSEAGYKDITKELAAVEKEARKNGDPYTMALCANALYNLGEKTRGDEMVARIINSRGEVGFWTGKKHSITRSTGQSLTTETTSLILLAMLKATNPDVQAISSAVKYLVGARSGYGGFGSTQATILALKALTRYAEFSKRTDEAGTIEVLINDKTVAHKDFAKGERNNITIDGLEQYILTGKQQIEVRFTGCRQALPYSVNVSYNTTLPESSKECVVNLQTSLSAKHVKVGETLRLSATLKNTTAQGQPMTMAILGIPAGFSAQPWQLKQLQEKGIIDFYEVVGNNIACYYRCLAPAEQKQINLDLKAEIPGEYDAPASCAYLYYTNEHKHWAGLNRVFVNP